MPPILGASSASIMNRTDRTVLGTPATTYAEVSKSGPAGHRHTGTGRNGSSRIVSTRTFQIDSIPQYGGLRRPLGATPTYRWALPQHRCTSIPCAEVKPEAAPASEPPARFGRV